MIVLQIKLTTKELTQILINAKVISSNYNIINITRSAGSIPTLIINLEVEHNGINKEI